MSVRSGRALSTRGKLLLGLGGAAAVAAGLRVFSRLPPLRADDAGGDRPGGTDTTLARVTRARADANPGLTGLYLLPDAHDAFAARVLMARQAERSLDLQYYIWHGDLSGTLMLEAVHQAAERGVHVRMLLDDNGISGLDTTLAALDRHPNIEVRLFNPFRIRTPKSIGYVVDFQRLNRRMHNKSFTADGAATIIGGRNVGDEYFGAGDGGLFADLDVLAIGPIVEAVKSDFDRYWHSAASYPAARILGRVGNATLERLARTASLVERDPAARAFVDRLRELPLIRHLVDGTLEMCWAEVRMISDDPAKALGTVAPATLLATKLADAIGTPQRELVAIAGYFVPGEQGTDAFCDLARRGVSVSVLTNSFAATDVSFLHAGYAPYRRRLLSAGVRLFELCGVSRDAESGRERRRSGRIGVGSTLRGSGKGSVAAARSRAATLHAKTFAVDRERLFIGSFNLDPRSRDLNTELGFVIDSSELATRVAEAFSGSIQQSAYEVTLTADDRLQWIERAADRKRAHAAEPNMTAIDRGLNRVFEALPIQWLL